MFELLYYTAFIWAPAILFWEVSFFGKKYLEKVAAIQGLAFLKAHSGHKEEYKGLALKHLAKLLLFLAVMFLIPLALLFLMPEIWLYWITLPLWIYLLIFGLFRLILTKIMPSKQ